MYNAKWHDIYAEVTSESAKVILKHLLSVYPAQSLVEVGCGSGHWSRAAVNEGISDYLATDGVWNEVESLVIDRSRYVVSDLRETVEFGRRFDLAVCLEVAEHLESEAADRLVQTIVGASDVVLFSAAIPLQGGFGHVNERWPSWWREKFRSRGYALYDVVRPKVWSDKAVHYWYRQNAFVYVKSDAAEIAGRFERLQATLYTQPVLIDAVHPEKFHETASYQSIAGKRLFEQLPRWLWKRVVQKLQGIG